MHKISLLTIALLLAAPQLHPAIAAPAGPRKQIIAGVNVTGLDQAARARKLRRVLNRKLSTRLLLKGGARATRQTRRALGIRLDVGWMIGRANRGDAYVPLKLRVDNKRAEAAMKRLATRFQVGGREARIVNRKRGMQIVPERVGQTLNINGSWPRLIQAIGKNTSAREVALLVRKQKPRRTRADFKGITGRLATFSTEYNADKKGRTFNMVLASRAIDGAIVKPGGVFSLNSAVGERTKARGYQAAIIFEDGKKKQGLGGGVSQVTGTLFNAALLAGLPIASYQTHSRPVPYLPVGRDATVSWGNFDMKFKNPTSAPLYISYVVKGGVATASIFGKRTPGQKVRLRVVSKTLGARKVTAQLYRTVLRGGKVAFKQKVGDSNYSWKVDTDD